MPKTRRPTDPRQKVQEIRLDFSSAKVASAFIHSIIYGPVPEIAAFGSRGEGKTTAVLTAMIGHAKQHYMAGFKLPVPWIGVTDTFTSHKLKTCRTLQSPIWGGGWKFSDGDHVATFYEDGTALVHLDLFGIEDQGAMDRVRMETVGVWFEEPAPAAVMVQSSGISIDAWMLAGTSAGLRRIPSHFFPKVATLNYPDEDHWTWEHWNPTTSPVFTNPANLRDLFAAVEFPWPEEFNQYPNGSPLDLCVGGNEQKKWFRIPGGERASHDDRMLWAKALKDRPDLLRRLIFGQPGVVLLGDAVAQGFSHDYHVSKKPLRAVPSQPLFLGFDGGHTPTCVIGCSDGARINVLAGLHMKGAGMKQLLEEQVLPFLGRFAPWTLKRPDEYLYVGYDPTLESGDDADITNSPITVIREMLGDGQYEPGPMRWPPRKDALVSVFNRRNAVLFDAQWCADLIKALNGRWYYPKTHIGELRSDQPKKPNHPWEDLGDAFIYMLCRFGVTNLCEPKPEPKTISTFDPRVESTYTNQDFDSRMM